MPKRTISVKEIVSKAAFCLDNTQLWPGDSGLSQLVEFALQDQVRQYYLATQAVHAVKGSCAEKWYSWGTTR